MNRAYQTGHYANHCMKVPGLPRPAFPSHHRVLARITLACAAMGVLGTAQAGGHILGIHGAIQAKVSSESPLESIQLGAYVKPPVPITGVRGWV